MKLKLGEDAKRALAVFAISFVLASHPAAAGWAQNLGQQPQFNTAVQWQTLPASGQAGAQPRRGGVPS